MPGTDGIPPHGELRSASSKSWGRRRSSSESSCKPFLLFMEEEENAFTKGKPHLPNLIAFGMRGVAWWLRGDQWLLFILAVVRLLTLLTL